MDALMQALGAHAFWQWLALAAALLAVETATGSGWLLWASAAAALTGVAAEALALPLPIALTLFAVLTMASSLLARRYLPRAATAEGGDINDNIARLVGREAEAASPFVRGAGRVFIDGKEWAAELEDAETLDAGARVAVVGVSGACLRVRAG